MGPAHRNTLALCLFFALWPGCTCGPDFDDAGSNSEGCGPVNTAPPDKCGSDWDCDGSDICRQSDAGNRTCRPADAPCTRNADCPPGKYCGESDGCGSGKHQCIPLPDADVMVVCLDQLDCPPNYQCIVPPDSGYEPYGVCQAVDASSDAPIDAQEGDDGASEEAAPDAEED